MKTLNTTGCSAVSDFSEINGKRKQSEIQEFYKSSVMQKVLFLGAGNMGSAILKAAIRGNILHPPSTYIVDPNTEKTSALAKELGVQVGNPGDCSVIILAVKPQSLDDVFPLDSGSNPFLISVLAGTDCKTLSEKSGIDQICRVMPNTPALVKSGMSGIFCSKDVLQENRSFCRALFSACGKVIEIEDEEQMHTITALSGSGPAYFFRFAECLAIAGEKMGLSAETASLLAKQTLIGSARLLEESGEEAPSLRKKVTSPGGTTQAALETFEKLHLQDVVQSGVESAVKRSRELGEK